jgi:hypothetical protein
MKNTKIQKNTNGIYTILYYQSVDIDGFHCRDEFVDLINTTKGKRFFTRAHEWCCGHGAIGFRILEKGLCRNLVLTDLHQPATQGCEFTVALNDLQNKVTVYNTENLGDLPDHERWDLFVANPPWRPVITPGPEFTPGPNGPELSDDNSRKMFDVGWKTHNILWNNLTKYLTPDADVYLYEDSNFSNRDTWKDQISQANLQIVGVYENFGFGNTGYVMHLRRK